MNIYIYGDKSFKKDISKILSRSSISIRLDEISQSDELMGKIIKVDTIKSLKSIIEEDDNNIFLIDNKKIIYDNFLTKIFKFLNPKDGIEKKFLEKYEIAISVEINDVASITQYILNRLDTYKIDEITHIHEIREDDIVSALSDVEKKGI